MIIETNYTALAHAGQEGLPLIACDGVVAIGNFDGVHLGHKALLAHGCQLAMEQGVKLVALTFAPHPRLYFKHDQKPFLLSDTVQKHEQLLAAGADTVVSLTFDAILSGLSAEEFAQNVLRDALCARHVVIGDNFVFGKGRGGDVSVLKELGKAYNFDVSPLSTIHDLGGQRISSEYIREKLRHGHTATAEDLLGRPWQIRGKVVRGLKHGREIGFPTANIELEQYLQPALGIYTAKARIEGEEGQHKAVAYIGQRPSIGSHAPLLEVHLLDFKGNIYGKQLRVDLVDFLRPDYKFADMKALKAQIAKDVAQARASLVS